MKRANNYIFFKTQAFAYLTVGLAVANLGHRYLIGGLAAASLMGTMAYLTKPKRRKRIVSKDWTPPYIPTGESND